MNTKAMKIENFVVIKGKFGFFLAYKNHPDKLFPVDAGLNFRVFQSEQDAITALKKYLR